jgi:NitT/TauT family transport system permease protein
VLIRIPLGILAGWYRPLEAILDPFIAIFNATPGVALMPLIIIWFGIGEPSKVAVIFLGAIFAILLSTITGVKNLDATLITAARSFGASSFQIFRTVALPGTVPFMLSGIRLGLGHALIGIVVGELYGASGGIGYLIAVAGMTFQTDKVLVGVVIIAICGMVLSTVSRRVEGHFQSWRPTR